MPALSNPTHEKFAQNVAKGMTGAEAYRKLKMKGNAHRQRAAQMLSLLTVKKRIAEIQEMAAQGAVLTMRERREFIARNVRLNPTKFNKETDGDLVQEMTVTTKGKSVTVKYKFPGKLECIMADARLTGELDKENDGASITNNEFMVIVQQSASFIAPPGRDPKTIDVDAEVLELDSGL